MKQEKLFRIRSNSSKSGNEDVVESAGKGVTRAKFPTNTELEIGTQLATNLVQQRPITKTPTEIMKDRSPRIGSINPLENMINISQRLKSPQLTKQSDSKSFTNLIPPSADGSINKGLLNNAAMRRDFKMRLDIGNP